VKVHRPESISMSMSMGESAWIAGVMDCRGRKEAGWLHTLAAELQGYISGNKSARCAHRLTGDAGTRGCGDDRAWLGSAAYIVGIGVSEDLRAWMHVCT
jgi:hypothetical protein